MSSPHHLVEIKASICKYLKLGPLKEVINTIKDIMTKNNDKKEKKEKVIQVSYGSPVKKEPDVILSLSDLRTGQQDNAEGRTSPRLQRPVITSSLHIVCPALTRRLSCTCCVYIGRSALTPPAVTEVAQQELASVHTQVRPIKQAA